MKKQVGIVAGAMIIASTVIAAPFLLVEHMVKKRIDSKEKNNPLEKNESGDREEEGKPK